MRTTAEDSAPVIRLAVPQDRGPIVEFCRATWGPQGEDYIERVIERWIAGAEGALAVAELGGRAVACCYIRFPSPREAFLAGMRVDPARRRAGLSLALTDYCVRYAESHGRTVVRAIIGWNNAPALGAIARAGFTRVGSMTLWERVPRDAASEPDVAGGTSLTIPFRPRGALWAVGWMVRELTDEDIEERIRAGWAVTHDGGLALLRPGDEHLWLAWLSGPPPARATLARAAAAAAARGGFHRCLALLANDPDTERALGAAGFSRGLEYHVAERRTR